MARCLIIGCGCRGRLLAADLCARGHAVRGTTRDPDHLGAIAGAGAEAVIADPDRVATITPALEHVSVVCLLLGSAVGTAECQRALHGPRLEMLLGRMLDTTVHALLYEAAGSVEPAVLHAGAEVVRETCRGSRIPYVLLDRNPAHAADWVRAASAAIEGLIAG